MNVLVRGVPLWRWVCFFGLLTACLSAFLVVVLAFHVYPIAVSGLLTLGGLGLYGAFLGLRAPAVIVGD